jgi:hypothetical protein
MGPRHSSQTMPDRPASQRPMFGHFRPTQKSDAKATPRARSASRMAQHETSRRGSRRSAGGWAGLHHARGHDPYKSLIVDGAASSLKFALSTLTCDDAQCPLGSIKCAPIPPAIGPSTTSQPFAASMPSGVSTQWWRLPLEVSDPTQRDILTHSIPVPCEGRVHPSVGTFRQRRPRSPRCQSLNIPSSSNRCRKLPAAASSRWCLTRLAACLTAKPPKPPSRL